MKPSIEKLVTHLERTGKDHPPTLWKHPFYKDKYQVYFFYVEDHWELVTFVEALISICRYTLERDGVPLETPEHQLDLYRECLLKLAERLTPKGDISALDGVHEYMYTEKLHPFMHKNNSSGK